jgi:hypothetical protein
MPGTRYRHPSHPGPGHRSCWLLLIRFRTGKGGAGAGAGAGACRRPAPPPEPRVPNPCPSFCGTRADPRYTRISDSLHLHPVSICTSSCHRHIERGHLQKPEISAAFPFPFPLAAHEPQAATSIRLVATNCEVIRLVATNCEVMRLVATNCEVMRLVATDCEVMRLVATDCEVMRLVATDCEVLSVVFSFSDIPPSPALTLATEDRS